MKKYKSSTTGRVDKLQTYQCAHCLKTHELFESDEHECYDCTLENEDAINVGIIEQCEFIMQPIFSPKNNGQRVYIRDERK